ncbi:GHKL domain-containing protein [Bengtsoniella intestinalis]|uniref:GHKL domain-containing protein n=1 Tax=Bengtsoniella intestinalis TaxID=3073143 RepID=UPI00391F1B00
MRKLKLLRTLVIGVALLPLLYLFIEASQFGFYGTWREIQPQFLNSLTLEMDGTATDIALPYVLQDGTPGQTVVLSSTLTDMGAARIYFKSVFAPVQVYANDTLIYAYGQFGTYPDYLDDPPTISATVELPNEEVIDLRLEYTYPTTRDDLILDSILVGTYPAIFSYLFGQPDSQPFLYLICLVLGLFFICIGFLIRIIERQGTFFVWLGLITLSCSLWGLGEYDPTVLFIHNAGMVSLITFVSVYYLPALIHCFFRSTVQYHNPRPMTVCIFVCFLAATTATVLQATSLLSYYNALTYFRWFAPASFCFGIVYTVHEWRVYGNRLAKWFLFPWCIVIVTTAAEGIRLMGSDIYTYGRLVQFSLMLFIFLNTLIGANLIQKAFALREQNRRMEQNYKIMAVQVAEQEHYHHLLMETRQTLTQQRHDLHHQLTVIEALVQEGNLDKLHAYVNNNISAVPEVFETYCANIAVNAMVSHYASQAKTNGIDVTIDLVVPASTPRISANNLCVIFGNILENATEACARMDGGAPFISLTSHVHNGLLVILQKNSFDGAIHQKNGVFYSSKRDEAGIGLSSVASIAHKHNGSATFTAQDQVFQSAIYVCI